MLSDGSAAELPPTIQALLAARLDRLLPLERAVLERAAVVGKEFWPGAVAELSTEEERSEIGSVLLTLVRKELVRPEPSQFPGEDGFRFRHALIRDAAYGAIPKRVRADLHENFVGWLERHGGEEELVGYHLEQAALYRAELGERNDALAARAGELLGAAGTRAAARGDARAALTLLRRALALLPPQHGSRVELLRELSTALWLDGDADAAELALSESIERRAGHGQHAHRVVRPPRACGAERGDARRDGCARRDRGACGGGLREARRRSRARARVAEARARRVHGAPLRRHRGGVRAGARVCGREWRRAGACARRRPPVHGTAVRAGACRRGDRARRGDPRVRRAQRRAARTCVDVARGSRGDACRVRARTGALRRGGRRVRRARAAASRRRMDRGRRVGRGPRRRSLRRRIRRCGAATHVLDAGGPTACAPVRHDARFSCSPNAGETEVGAVIRVHRSCGRRPTRRRTDRATTGGPGASRVRDRGRGGTTRARRGDSRRAAPTTSTCRPRCTCTLARVLGDRAEAAAARALFEAKGNVAGAAAAGLWSLQP